MHAKGALTTHCRYILTRALSGNNDRGVKVEYSKSVSKVAYTLDTVVSYIM